MAVFYCSFCCCFYHLAFFFFCRLNVHTYRSMKVVYCNTIHIRVHTFKAGTTYVWTKKQTDQHMDEYQVRVLHVSKIIRWNKKQTYIFCCCWFWYYCFMFKCWRVYFCALLPQHFNKQQKKKKKNNIQHHPSRSSYPDAIIAAKS